MGEPRFHRGRHAERLVQPREIVVHEVQRDGGLVVARHTLSMKQHQRVGSDEEHLETLGDYRRESGVEVALTVDADQAWL